MRGSVKVAAGSRNYPAGYSSIRVAAYCIVFGSLRNRLEVLLLNRDMDPGKDKSSLIGGFVREDESLDEAVQDLDQGHIGDHGLRWCQADECKHLIFDHNKMMDMALRRLQQKVKSQPIGFELLPKKFSVPRLLDLYGAIYQKKNRSQEFQEKVAVDEYP